MSVSLKNLETYLGRLMKVKDFEDYAPNGLQVEGCQKIQSLITSPSLSLNVIQYAAQKKAQAIVVHHGLFWKNEARVMTGPLKKKIELLFQAGINLLAYHLPLDFLVRYGNNEPVLRHLCCRNIEAFENIGYSGSLEKAMDAEAFYKNLNAFYETKGSHIKGPKKIKKVAVVSGAGSSFLGKAIDSGCDAFITGEASEWVYSMAKERQISFSAMGHYKSEVLGVRLLGEHLAKKFKIKNELFLEDNPF